ncbi:hypothetical protein PI125_g26565 [Phytophthora idaei]|nr:hypothetical protein PI125_g26565 [Phytophthora idaei]
MYGSVISRRSTRRDLPSASLTATSPRPSRTVIVGGSTDKHDARKKLFVALESRSARSGRRAPAT